MKNFLIGIVVVGLLLVAALFGIDREVARRDYIGKTELSAEVNGCIFQINCDHYNKLLMKIKDDDVYED